MASETTNKLKEDIVRLFNKQSQYQQHHPSGIKEFIKIYKHTYNSVLLEDFMTIFIQVIRSVLIKDRTSPFTKRTLEFITKLFKEIIAFEDEKEYERLQDVARKEINEAPNTSSLDISMENTDELANEAFDPADQTIINENYLSPISSVDLMIKRYFVQFLYSENINVRYNTTSLLKSTLEIFNEIDEGTFVDLRKGIVDRTFDKEKTIQALAVLALNKLQCAEQEDTPLKTLKFHLLRNPDATVRLCALKTIEVNRDTIRSIYLTTRDVNTAIRKTVYSKIAQNCKLENFGREDRHILMMNGTNERDDRVREVFFKQVIAKFITDRGLFSFAQGLAIKKDPKLYEKLFLLYFTSLSKTSKKNYTQFHELVFDFRAKHLDEFKLFTKSPLTQESAFIWYLLCHFCKKFDITFTNPESNKKQGDQENEIESEENEEAEKVEIVDLIDEILPDIPYYCKYLNGFIDIIQDSTAEIERKRFMFVQLLRIGQLYKIGDIAQWNYVSQTLKKIIMSDVCFSIFENYIEEVMKIYSNYYNNEDEKFLDQVFELINSLNYSNHHDGNLAENQTNDYSNQLKILQDLLNDKYEKKSKAILGESNDNVEELNNEIEGLIERRTKIVEAQMSQDVTLDHPPRMETDKTVLQRCLHICFGYFLPGGLKSKLTRLPGLINQLVLPNLDHTNPSIRTLSVKTLGLYCLPSIDLINHFIKVFLEIVDNDNYNETRIEALKMIFDFLCYHGFTGIKFINHDYTQHADKSVNNAQDVTNNILERCKSNDFIEIFMDTTYKFLEEPMHEHDKQRTNMQALIEHQLLETSIKGFCKIMNYGRFFDSELFARLIVIFFGYKKIDECITQFVEGFFYLYVANFKLHMKSLFGIKSPFVEAYVPCLTILIQKENLKEAIDTDTLITFFIRMIEDEQSDLILKAISMLTEENKVMWEMNLKLILLADWSNVTQEQLEKIRNDIDEFNSHFAQAVPRRGKRGVKDKNADMAKQILARVQEKLVNCN